MSRSSGVNLVERVTGKSAPQTRAKPACQARLPAIPAETWLAAQSEVWLPLTKAERDAGSDVTKLRRHLVDRLRRIDDDPFTRHAPLLVLLYAGASADGENPLDAVAQRGSPRLQNTALDACEKVDKRIAKRGIEVLQKGV